MSAYATATRENATSMASSVLSPTNINEAKNFAKQSAAEFRRNLDEGSLSLRLLALAAGIAMMVMSALGFLGDVLKFHWIDAVFQVYTFLFGCVILCLESSRQMSCFQRLETNLYKNALFLKYVWGRGLLYFFAGTLMISFHEFLYLVVGCFVCFVGIVYVVVGRSSARKMADMRRQTVSQDTLQNQFAMADVDGKGSLTTKQFHNLTSSLGMDLTRREIESVFLQSPSMKDRAGRVSYESVSQWWYNEGIEFDDFQGTPARVV